MIFSDRFHQISPNQIFRYFDKRDKIQIFKNIKVNVKGGKILAWNINKNQNKGPEETPGTLLKIGSQELALFMYIFRASLDQIELQKNWKIAKINH